MAQSTVKHPEIDVTDLTEQAPIQVLHVDDEAGFLKAAKQILEMQGAFQVDTASSVEEATEKMKHKPYDMIVSDYIMPGKDGLQFLKELRDSGNNIPFIIFTGKGREIVAIKALNLGADQYVNKIGSPEAVYSELAHGIRKVVKTKRAEEALRESEDKYRRLFEDSSDGLVIIDRENGSILDCNQEFMRQTGRNREQLLEMKIWDVRPPQLRDATRRKFFEVRSKRTGGSMELDFQKPSGEIVPIDFLSKTTTIGSKEVLQSRCRDITERKKTEGERNKLLHDYNERIKELRCLYRISKLVEKPNISKEEILQETCDLLRPAWQYPDATCSRIVFEKREFKTENFKVTRWKQSSDIKIDGKKAGVVEVYYLEEKPMMDEGPFLKEERALIDAVAERLGRIIERKKTEEELNESDNRLTILFENSPDGLVLSKLNGVTVDTNKTLDKLMGFERKETVGKNFFELGLISKKQIPKALALLAKIALRKPAGPSELTVTRKDGSQISVEIRMFPVTLKGETLMLGSLRDISQRKKTDEELKNSEDRLRVLFEFAPDAYYLNDLKGNFVDGNKAAEELTGYNRNELIGKSFLKLKLLSRRQVLRAAKLLAKNVLGKSTGPDEFVLNRKGGSQVAVEIRTHPMKIKGQTLVLGIARDITERKKAEGELRLTLGRLETLNEKLGVVGKLTRHDVRNKLSAVTMSAFLAKEKLASDHEALEHLGQIESAVSDVARIFEFARIYEMLGVEALAYLDVEKSLGEAVILFSDLHSVQVVNGCHGLTVLADSLLRQLLYNLIDNSLKHGEKVSQIRVHFEEAGKDKLRLVYEDDGVGISRSEKRKIFMEGYGKGTGYGLYLIQKMCEVYGWTIRETGKQGKGAQFTITIPRLSQDAKENYRIQ